MIIKPLFSDTAGQWNHGFVVSARWTVGSAVELSQNRPEHVYQVLISCKW